MGTKIVLLGASGSGKSTIEDELCCLGAKNAISHTTRPYRSGEVNGKDYFFVSEKFMKELIKRDFMVEYAVYNGYYYALSKESLKESNIIVIEPQGLKSLKEKNIKICSFYVKVSEENRKQRMLKRGDSLESIENRLANDREAFKDVEKEVDYIIPENLNKEETVNFILSSTLKHIYDKSENKNNFLASLLFNLWNVKNLNW